MPNFRERIAGLFAAASSTGVSFRVTNDTQDRVAIDAGGRISWGTGAAVADTTLQRSASNTLTMSGGTLVANVTGNISGNAGTSTVLQTARTITVGSTGRSFDGSANISWTLAEIGVNNATLTVNTSGVGLSGSGTWTSNQATNATITVTSNATSANTGNTIVSRDGSGDFIARQITANLTGNASTATTLATARNINEVSFNGSANITVPRIRAIDDRVIAPADMAATYTTAAFTSWNNNNTSPYGDALVMRTYGDATGGNDNMLVLRKDQLGLRVWQQTWNSSTAFQTFKDVAWTDGTNATGTWSIGISGTAANANLLDNLDSTYFAAQSNLDRVLGDLLFVGLYNPGRVRVTDRAISSNVVTITTETAHGYVAGDVIAVRVPNGGFGISNKAIASNVATLTTSVAHGFAVGQQVLVSGVDATFDGTYTITAVTSTTFSYAKVATNTSAASDTGYAALAALYGEFTVLTAPTTTTFTYSYTNTNLTALGTTTPIGWCYEIPRPTWSGPAGKYRHAMYWIVSNEASDLDFINNDYSGRITSSAEWSKVAKGDWVIAINPLVTIPTQNNDLDRNQVSFQIIPFSTETYIAAEIAKHSSAADPHAAAGYLNRTRGDAVYAQLGHNHNTDISNAITVHRTPPTVNISNKALTSNVATLTTSTAHAIQVGMGVRVAGVDTTFDGVYEVTAVTTNTLSYAKQASNVTSVASGGQVRISPHPEYIQTLDADNKYAPVVHRHDTLYEPIGAVAAHVALTDPHPQYLTPAEGDAAYAPVVHNHDLLYYTKAQVDSAIAAVPREVFTTDSTQVGRIFIGATNPASASPPLTPIAGDLWIETFNLSVQPPAAATSFTAVAPSATSVTLSWAAWSTATAQNALQLERKNGATWATPVLLIDVTSGPFATTFTDTGRVEKTEYTYRVRAKNNSGINLGDGIGWGPWVEVTVRTPNGAPGAPTSLSASGITATQITLSWSAPSPFDGSGSGDNYEVFLNGVSRGFASGANTSFTFGSGAVGSSNPPLTERTTYTVGVRAKDAGDFNTGLNKLFSPIVTLETGPTANAAPPVPKNLTTSGITHNQATLTWAAGDPVLANGHPAGGITDFLRYRLYLNDVEVAQTTNTSYTFTGLPANTANQKLEVRAEDTSNSLSTDNASTVNITTLQAPDSSPPTTPTITSFQPAVSYGRMRLVVAWPNDSDTTLTGEVTYQPGGGGAPVVWSQSVTRNTSSTINFGDAPYSITESAGNTVSVSVRWRDPAGNWSSAATSSYTLIASPYLLSADASNSWRNESGGRYNSAGNFRLIQGYFSNPSLNSIGLWYYGTKIADQVFYGGRRTVSNIEIYMQRNTGGDGVPRDVSIVLHNETTSPGNAYTTAPATFNTPTVVATLQWGGGNAWATIPSGWQSDLLNGTRRGVAIRDTDGIPYVVLDSVTENGQSGQLKFTHLG